MPAKSFCTPASFQPPGKMTIRCDKIASGSSTGCVFPSVTPTLMLPLENRGQVNVAWSMQSLADHWGWEGKGSPLTREMDEAVMTAHRGKRVTPRGRGTRQSPTTAAMSSPPPRQNRAGRSSTSAALSGKDCPQIRPDTPSGGQRKVSYVNDTSGRRRTIGHVPNRENSSVGGSMSAFCQNERVLDNEKFRLAFGR
ncbi:hypothetical protein ACFVJH_05630 [Streptomyces decoyicus]|uniref:hypothetical protein n=1 Tax=Streptomyces decoyicus TaxID=249567 RepID=UPI00362A36D3